jgi:hypothetical protein
MNSTTLSTMAKTQPTEPLLEHEIRLRAYDLYEQRGRDGRPLRGGLAPCRSTDTGTDLLTRRLKRRDCRASQLLPAR